MIFYRNDNIDIETEMDNGMNTGINAGMNNGMSAEMNTGMNAGKNPGMNNSMNTGMGVQDMHKECEKLMNYHATFITKYGSRFDGIIESAGPEHVIILVAEDIVDQGDEEMSQKNMKTRDNGYDMQRQYTNPRRYRRFRRRPFPYNTLSGIAVPPYPYYAPPYPYYPF